MRSMTDVYGVFPLDLDRTQRRSLGRLVLGISAVLFIISVIAGTTHIFENLGMSVWESRELSGVLGGTAIPLLISGVFVLLPSSQAEQQLAFGGISLSILGVLLFQNYYPDHWNGYGLEMTFPVVALYFVGVFTAFAAMFFTVSNITIQSPGGVIMKTVKEGAQTVLDTEDTSKEPTSSATHSSLDSQDSGVGFIGDPKTNAADNSGKKDDAVILGEEPETPPQMIDEYCGNCEHFSYRHVGGERRPYCGLHDEMMDDLEACNEWTPQQD